MNLQKFAAIAGAAVTTFLLVGAATIEAVTAATGADIGPGIIAVFAGVAAGLVAAMLVSWRWATLREWHRSVLLGYAAFGLTMVFLAFLSYVNTPGVDDYLSIDRNLVIAALTAAIVAIWGGTSPSRGPRPEPGAARLQGQKTFEDRTALVVVAISVFGRRHYDW